MQKPTEAFRQRLAEAFEQIPLGKAYTWRRTFTEADVTLFCGITGDLNPYHQDELFARESWYGRRIVPGLLTASMITHIGGMVGFLATEMTFEFQAPVYPGDTITCTVTFGERDVALRRMVGSALRKSGRRRGLAGALQRLSGAGAPRMISERISKSSLPS